METYIDKVFIVHYTPLIERKKNIITQLESFGITNYEFIEVSKYYDTF